MRGGPATVPWVQTERHGCSGGRRVLDGAVAGASWAASEGRSGRLGVGGWAARRAGGFFGGATSVGAKRAGPLHPIAGAGPRSHATTAESSENLNRKTGRREGCLVSIQVARGGMMWTSR